jgi:exonuclease SbcC
VIPRKLILKNFLSHTHSEIDFSKFDVALILGLQNGNVEESNGSGKSAILEAIRWVLFDKCRHKKKDSIVKRDKTNCSVKYEFSINDQIYLITRRRNKVVSETDVILERWNGSKFESIGCDTNTATDYKIVQIINFNHDIFINSVYFKQGDISIFTESTPGKRKDILKSLLKLDKWDDYQKKVKKYYNNLNTKLNEKQKNCVSIELLEDDIEKYELNIKDIKGKLNEKNKVYKQLNGELIKRKAEFKFIEDDSSQQSLINLEEELSETKNKLSNVKRTITLNEKLAKNNELEVSKFTKRLSVYNDKIDAKNNANLEKKWAGLLEGKAKEKVIREKISHLKQEIKLDKLCDVCLRPIKSKEEARKIKLIRKSELDKLKEKHESLVNRIKHSEISLKKLEKIVSIGKKAEVEKSKTELKLTMLKGEIKKARFENKQLVKKVDINKINNLKDEIKELKLKLNKNNINKLKSNIKNIESKLPEIKKSIDKLNINYGSKVSNKNELISKKLEQIKLHNEVDKLKDKLIIYDKLRHCFGKDGIQSIIIENVVDELENYTNSTLSKICNEPTSIYIKMQKQSDSGSWNETFDIEVNIGNRKDEFEALSGGEKFRISLALRLAFSKILSKRMGGVVKFLLLDEVSSSLDPKGLNMFANIVKQLGNEMKVLVITHDDKLKDKFDNIIVVEKDNTGSRVRE